MVVKRTALNRDITAHTADVISSGTGNGNVLVNATVATTSLRKSSPAAGESAATFDLPLPASSINETSRWRGSNSRAGREDRQRSDVVVQSRVVALQERLETRTIHVRRVSIMQTRPTHAHPDLHRRPLIIALASTQCVVVVQLDIIQLLQCCALSIVSRLQSVHSIAHRTPSPPLLAAHRMHQSNQISLHAYIKSLPLEVTGSLYCPDIRVNIRAHLFCSWGYPWGFGFCLYFVSSDSVARRLMHTGV